MNYAQLAREFKYKYKKGNLSLNTWSGIKNNINPNMPIRPSSKWRPSEWKDLQFDLSIFVAHFAALQSKSKDCDEANDYLNLLLNWSEENNTQTVKQMKLIEKSVRINSKDLVLQSLLTFHRAYDFYPSNDGFNSAIAEYVDHYMDDEKFHPESVYKFSNRTLKFLINAFFDNLRIELKKDYKYPSVSLSKSPIGDKSRDFRNICNVLKAFPVTQELDYNLKLINTNLQLMGVPQLEYTVTNKSFSDIDQIVHYPNIAALAPKLSFIPSPGKLRPIFISNDIYDVILDPFRIMVRWFSRGLNSSYNSKRITDEDYLNVDLPTNVREVYNYSQELLNSSLVNSDLSSATDKIYSDFQNKLLLDLFELIRMKRPNVILMLQDYFGISDIIEYIRNSLDIISMSFISVSYTLNGNNTYGFVRPKYGQCQGQRGSFDLLHLTHTAVCMESIYKTTKINLDRKKLPFLINGDDGVIPEVIEKYYSQLWVLNSDEGIKSEDKSTTRSTDYVEFCKQYVRFNPNARQPLNGLRFPTFAKFLSNPSMIIQMRERYDQSDMWLQVRMLNESINKMDIYVPSMDYSIMNIPPDKSSEIYKLRSLLLELMAKLAIQYSDNQLAVDLIRSRIDTTESIFNVFDRERLVPSEDHSDAYDWVTRIGLITISRKFGLDVEEFVSIDIDQLAIDCVLNNKTLPGYVLELAIQLDPTLYQKLTGKQNISPKLIVRRTESLNIHWSVKPHKLLIQPEVSKCPIQFV